MLKTGENTAKAEHSQKSRICNPLHPNSDHYLTSPHYITSLTIMHQSFETPGIPPPLGDDRGIAGTFTSCSPNIGSPVVGGYAKSHGLCLPDRGISGDMFHCQLIQLYPANVPQIQDFILKRNTFVMLELL